MAIETLCASGESIESFKSVDGPFFQNDPCRKAVFKDRYLGISDLGTEGGFYLRSGGVSPCMQDAGHTVCGFACKCDLAVQRIERDPEFNQIGDAVWGFVGEDSDGFFVAEPRPCGKSVLEVELRGVLEADRGCDAPLGMASIAVFDTALGY